MATKSRDRPSPKIETKKTSDSFPLAAEVKTYESHLPSWSDREGQFVLIKRDQILGFYPRYEEALAAGYERIGRPPFLVKRILRDEPIHLIGQIEF